MKNINANFLRILKIEIEDLQMDIEELITECENNREKGVITNYVCMENLTVFKNEIHGLGVFNRIVDKTDPEEFDTLDDMIIKLKEGFRKAIHAHGLVEAVYVCVARKLKKVAKYFEQVR